MTYTSYSATGFPSHYSLPIFGLLAFAAIVGLTSLRAFSDETLEQAFVRKTPAAIEPKSRIGPNFVSPTESSSPAERVKSLSAFPALADGTSQGLDPNQIVLRAVQQAVWGPSVHCRIRQSSKMGDYRLEGEGEYWGAGQGSGQLKMVMHLSSGELQSEMIQVSDGRLLWTSTGNEAPLRRVYLDSVRAELGSMAKNPTHHQKAALYLAIGGHAEMLRSLYVRYRWFKIWAGKDDQAASVWQLVGTLRTETPNPCSQTQTDNYLSLNTPPAETPTDVRLTLDRDGRLPLFPYKIEYYHREPSEDGAPGRLSPVSSITMEHLESPITITKDLFQYELRDDVEPENETADYLPSFPLADAATTLRR